MTQLSRFLQSEDGPTAVEYAVMVALIIVTCLSGIQCLGRTMYGVYSYSSAAVSGKVLPE